MSTTMEATYQLVCPECQATLPEERMKSPWCECGWSSWVEGWESQNIPSALRRRITRDREKALRLEKVDERVARLIAHPWGKYFWNLYLYVTLLLCLPVVAVNLFLIGILLAGWGIVIYYRLMYLIVILAMITGGILLYRWLIRREPDTLGIKLTQETAPELFKVLNEIAVHQSKRPIKTVTIGMNASIGIRQRWVWSWPPHFDNELYVGLLGLYSLTLSQFKAVLYHEFGHIQKKDPLASIAINHASKSLYSWTTIGEPGALVGLYFLPLLFILGIYFRLFAMVSRWAMRRKEYIADRIAAQSGGKITFQKALISLRAVEIAFFEQIPAIRQNLDTGFDMRDIYSQFVNMWEHLLVNTRQQYYARAVVSNRSVYDTHPSYQARSRFLSRLSDLPAVEEDNQPALVILPKAAELGRTLTINLYQIRRY